MDESTRAPITGPLARWEPELAGHLEAQGYTSQSVADHVRNLRLISSRLQCDGLEPAVVDEGLIERMATSLHQAGRAKRFTPAGCRVVLRFLRRRGAVPPVPTAEPTALEDFLADYRTYLVVERALAPLTVPGYVSSASWFLAESCDGDPKRVREVTAGDVASFVLAVAEVRTPAAVNTVVVGVRSLLRWLYATAVIDRPLAQATPWLARGASSTLPRSLASGQAEALVATCDARTLAGVRDLAMLKVLIRLGLRAGEVAAMHVDDIDWRRGELVVRGKGGWCDPLPLPVDVGDALVSYLGRRGAGDGHPQVFLRARAPRGALSMSGVRAVVRQACERAGIPDAGTHRLRHGVATDMLRHGASLHEIGQILRHRHLQTTAVYAKVDFEALASLARPWPGSER